MCNQPIRIKNRTKYLNNHSGQSYYLYVNCGKCEECIQQKQKEWNLRTFYQCLDCITKGGWLYFDTLTYDNEHIPRLSNYIDTNENWTCFDYRDIREFYEKLRGYYKGKDRNIIYFITSEYGALRKRNHYHILLFIYNNITTPEELSLNVSKAWNKGRTDGKPYKSTQYVITHNVLNKMNLNVIRYVAKYVNKSTSFSQQINKRWTRLEKYYEKSKYNKKQIKKIKQKYYRLTTPFHRQSQHYGENALLYMDLNDIITNNRIYYKDDSLKINQYCALPMYFKRKIFQEQIKVHGKRMWKYNELGVFYKQQREQITIDKLTDRLRHANKNKSKTYTDLQLQEVAKYIILERGRLKGAIDYNIHIEDCDWYNYASEKDELYLGKKCITKEYHGNDKIGYCNYWEKPIDLENEICIKDDLEAIIEDLNIDKDTTSKTLLKEHLNEIKKIFFQN